MRVSGSGAPEALSFRVRKYGEFPSRNPAYLERVFQNPSSARYRPHGADDHPREPPDLLALYRLYPSIYLDRRSRPFLFHLDHSPGRHHRRPGGDALRGGCPPHAADGKGEAVARLLVYVFMLIFTMVFVINGYAYALFGYNQTSELTGINLVFIHGVYLLAGISWFLFLGERILWGLAVLFFGSKEGIAHLRGDHNVAR